MPLLESKYMTIPASKVRLVCTSSETALVRASRKGELESLSTAQVKRMAAKARKLIEKWQDLGRDQSRERSRKVGVGDTSANTRLKEQIFREALTRFDARLAKDDSESHGRAKDPKRKTKQERASKHRSSRAAIRQDMSAAKREYRAPAPPKKKIHEAQSKRDVASPNGECAIRKGDCAAPDGECATRSGECATRSGECAAPRRASASSRDQIDVETAFACQGPSVDDGSTKCEARPLGSAAKSLRRREESSPGKQR
jgi:hypothetical protein